MQRRISSSKEVPECKCVMSSKSAKSHNIPQKEFCATCGKRIKTTKFVIKCKKCLKISHLVCLDPVYRPGHWFCSHCQVNRKTMQGHHVITGKY